MRKIERVRRELRELGGLKVEGEGDSYEVARERLMEDLDKLLSTVAAALGRRGEGYEEVRIEGDVELTRSNEVKREELRGYALVKVGRRRGRIIFSGEIARRRGRYTYHGVISDVEEAGERGRDDDEVRKEEREKGGA